MPLLPALQPLVDAARAAPPPDASSTVTQRRALAHSIHEQHILPLCGESPEIGAITDHEVIVEGSRGKSAAAMTTPRAATIPVRVYLPVTGGRCGVHLYFHGGGFWAGTIDHFDAVCRRIVRDAECAIVSVGYRLAPEHKFPTQPEDCYAALLWTVAQADRFGFDSHRISVGGASAGGNLAAVTALLARDRHGPAIALQVLEIPAMDLDVSRVTGSESVLDRETLQESANYYLADPADADNPYASPLHADDLSGLPPALVMTAEFDPLRDSGEAYARRLGHAGVQTTLHRWEGQFHGSQHLVALIPEQAHAYHAMVVQALRSMHSPGSVDAT